jgi:hypothetical protein
MPLKRTPPLTPTNLTASGTHSLAHSDPNLSNYSDVDSSLINITQRCTSKQKREDHIEKSDLEEIKSDIMNMFMELKSSIKELREQNNKLQESVDFVAAKYEEINTKIHQLEQEKVEDKKYIDHLEAKLEQLEKQGRITSVEIRNIPKQKTETKDDLINTILKIGNVLKVPINQSEVRDVFRTNGKTGSKPIIVEFTTVIQKERILSSIKKFNREHQDKLNTEHLSIAGPRSPVYLSENLTPRAKRLFFLARELASRQSFKYCWTSYGKIFIRKEEGAQLIRIESEADINSMKPQD